MPESECWVFWSKGKKECPKTPPLLGGEGQFILPVIYVRRADDTGVIPITI